MSRSKSASPCGQLLAQALEHPAHILVEPRLDDLRGPVVFLLVGVPAVGDLVAQRGDLARDLVQRARSAVDVAEIVLELERQRRHDDLGRVGARLVQHLVRRVQDLAEQIELLAQDLERQALRFVVPGDEVDHRDVALLAVAVAAADALLDALRVPRQVVVDDRLAELEVQPLCAGLGADEHLRPRAELVHQREPDGDFARRPGSRRKARTSSSSQRACACCARS